MVATQVQENMSNIMSADPLLALESIVTSGEILASSIVMVIWYSVITAMVIPKLYIIEKSQQSASFKLLRNLAIATNILFGLAFASTAVAGLIVIADEMNYARYIATYLITCICFIGGLCSLYLYLIHLLKLSFANSSFQISSWIWCSYLPILVIVVTLFALSFILLALGNVPIFIYSLSAAILLVVFVAVHIVYSFISRLFLLVLQQRQSISRCSSNVYSPSAVEEEHVTKSELSFNQRLLLQVITKHTVLWMQGIGIFVVALILSAIVTAALQESHPRAAFFVFLLFICIALVTVSILMFLTFQSTESWYFALCAACNKWTTVCCVKLAEKKLMKKNTGYDLESYVRLGDMHDMQNR